MSHKINRDPDQLYPPFRDLILKGLAACHKKGLAIEFYEGLRTHERSDWLYAQGRTREELDKVGLGEEPRSGRVITNAYGGKSKHNFGIAVDLVFDGDEQKDGIQWAWEGQYDYAAKIIKAVDSNLQWGGNWTTIQDKPHFHLKQPYSNSQLQAFYEEGGLYKIFSELDKIFKPPVEIVVPELTEDPKEIGKVTVVKVKKLNCWERFVAWLG